MVHCGTYKSMYLLLTSSETVPIYDLVRLCYVNSAKMTLHKIGKMDAIRSINNRIAITQNEKA